MLAVEGDINQLDFYINNACYASQKVDGDRVLTVIDLHEPVPNNVITFLNRRGERRSKLMPEDVLSEMNRLAASGMNCVLDGEVVEDCYWIFDCPSIVNDRGQILVSTNDPLSTRLACLQLMFEHWQPARTIRLLRHVLDPIEKSDLFTSVWKMGGEGIVMKSVSSIYRPGKKHEDWTKVKFTKTVDAFVTELGRNGKENAVYAVYDETGEEVEIGACSIAGKPKPGLYDVLELRYLYARNPETPRLYQPRMLRIRTDKNPDECKLDQLQFTSKEVV